MMGSAGLIRARAIPPAPEPLPDAYTRLSVQLVNGLPTTIDLDAELALVVLVPNGLATTWRDAEPTAIVSQSRPEVEPHRRPDLDLSPPAGVTATASAGGGALTSGTYYYEVTALGPKGESLPSDEVSAQVSGPGKVAVAWSAVGGADAYRVYRARDAGGEQVFYTVRTASLTDKGVAATVGPAPSAPSPFAAVDRAPIRLLLQQGAALSASIPLVAGLRRKVPDAGDAARGATLELAVIGWDIRAGSLRGSGDFGSRLDLAWRRADAADEQFEPPPLAPRVAQRLEPAMRMESMLGLDSSANGGSRR
jgi:hypothetical protein